MLLNFPREVLWTSTIIESRPQSYDKAYDGLAPYIIIPDFNYENFNIGH